MRLAKGRPWTELDGERATAPSALWARLPDGARRVGRRPRHPRRLRAVRHRPGPRPLGGGNSLDNTLRVARVVPTEWVLIDMRMHAVRNGFGHGLVHLWAEDGTLMATASQSTIVRHWKPRTSSGCAEPARRRRR